MDACTGASLPGVLIRECASIELSDIYIYICICTLVVRIFIYIHKDIIELVYLPLFMHLRVPLIS